MNALRTLRAGLIALVALVIAACADGAGPFQPDTGPLFNRGGASPGGGGTLAALHLAAPRTGPVTVRGLATPGEALLLTVDGFTLEVPAGAVSEPVTIQMTAPRGPFVLVRFQPHGLEFDQSVTLSYDLSGAAWSGGDLVGLYLGRGGIPGAGALGGLQTFAVSLAGDIASIQIEHFSGYIFASGRSTDTMIF